MSPITLEGVNDPLHADCYNVKVHIELMNEMVEQLDGKDVEVAGEIQLRLWGVMDDIGMRYEAYVCVCEAGSATMCECECCTLIYVCMHHYPCTGSSGV